jgi:hypothetical protein
MDLDNKEEKIKKLKENVILILERFPFYKYAAQINKISEDTLKRMRDDDKEFADGCESARASGIMKYANKASPEFMLKAVEPTVFKDRVDVTSGGKAIKTNSIVFTNFKDGTKS